VIRYIGLSEAGAATIRKVAAVHPIKALQIEYSLWSLEIEAEVLPTIHELGTRLVAYSPLSWGFLTGGIRKPGDLTRNRPNMPRFQGENFYKDLELVEKLQTLAKEKGCTPSRLAIAWVLAQGEDVVTIPGTKRLKYLEENIASEHVLLSKKDLESIEAMMPAGISSGTRYPEVFMKTLNG
jgi:aryl-alcohol dehydrogenase-like predicted oxidoreductase